MKEEVIKPQIDKIKVNPSLNEIFNFAQGLLNKIPETQSNEKADEKELMSTDKQLNIASLDSLLTTAKSIVNPTTLSLLSKTVNQPDTIRKDTTETASLKQAIEQLTAELNEVKEDLAQTKSSLVEKDLQLKEIETEIQLLKRRRRR